MFNNWQDIQPSLAEQQIRNLKQMLGSIEENLFVQGKLAAKDPGNPNIAKSIEGQKTCQELLYQKLSSILNLRKREFVKVSLNGPDFQAQKVKISSMTSVLHVFQKFFSSLYVSLSLGPVQKVAISPKLDSQSQLSIVDFKPGPFEILTEAQNSYETYGDSLEWH